MRYFILLLICIYSSPIFTQQTSYWALFKESSKPLPKQKKWIDPSKYLSYELDISSLESTLATQARGISTVIEVPAPNGEMESYTIAENDVVPQELKEKYPDIRTYSGHKISNPSQHIHLDIVPQGFHAMVLAPEGSYFIDPMYAGKRDLYVSYYRKDARNDALSEWSCGLKTDTKEPDKVLPDLKKNKSQTAVTLKTYRIAIAATGEYTAFHGGTIATGLAAIVTALNRVSGVYKQELAISFTLVPNNNLIIYTVGATDPYSNSDGPAMLGQNQNNINAVIGSANYDVGHVFSTGGGGVASLGVVCSTNSKARGVTGLPNPTGDPFYIDYVSHELGHQFDGNHTFNGNAGSCGGGNGNSLTAYEPGSGSTIQAYAGICSPQNLQNFSDPYFHLISLMEMRNHVTSMSESGSTCPLNAVLSNQYPVANANAQNINGKYIPKSTAFELTGSATDANGDVLSYIWEEWDLGLTGDINANSTTAPIFRSFNPGTSPTRVFPKIADILSGNTSYGEVLPAVARVLKFQFIVRDNNPAGGGYHADMITLNVDGASGPFHVSSQNTNTAESGTIHVTWDVANTNAAPINCASVDILLSTDGGLTFSHVLASATPNDGVHSPILPNSNIASARIKVKCTDNVFFDINTSNFPINVLPEFGNCNPGDNSANTNPIPEGIYLSGTNVSSSGRVATLTEVIFKPNSEANIFPNFQIDQGGLFTVLVNSCN